MTLTVGQPAPRVVTRAAGPVVIALVPPQSPRWQDRFPNVVVRATRDRQLSVEQLHLRSANRQLGLPDLRSSPPSRLADTVELLFAAGAPSADLLLVRFQDTRTRWLLGTEIQRLLDPFLDALPGAGVVLTDFAGPPSIMPRPTRLSSAQLSKALSALPDARRRWAERYQVAYLDDPGVVGEQELFLLRSLLGADAVLCRWSGAAADLARHGWRSGAALAAALAAQQAPSRSLVGATVDLPAGRRQPPNRASMLRYTSGPTRTDAARLEGTMVLALHPNTDRMQFVTEPTMREPLGDWPLPALRMVKSIHRQFVDAASRFVFETVDDGQAIMLAVALQRAVRGAVRQGLLVGPGGDGPPDIRAGADRSPMTPGLIAVVSAQLRPWSRVIRLRISLRPGGSPALEVQ